MRTRKQKGTGFFNKVRDFFSGRKTARRKAMRNINLTNSNKEKKKQLEKKWFKTKENKKNLKVLKGKIAPSEEEYEARKEAALENRSRFQKFFNRFYKPQTMPSASKQKNIEIEGILDSKENIRSPWNMSAVKKPNTELPIPQPQVSIYSKVVNGEKIDLAGQSMIIYLNAPLLYAMWKQEPPKATITDISDKDYEAFCKEVKKYDDKNIVVQRVLHMPGGLPELEQWRKEHEEGLGYSQGQYNVVNFKYTFPDGTKFQKKVIKIAGSVSASRLLDDTSKGKRKIIEGLEADIAQCVHGHQGTSRPITTFKTNDCISVFNTVDYQIFEASKGFMLNNWIILNPKYTGFTFQGLLLAYYFKSMQSVQRAFDNWGVIGMDPALFELIQYKYPEMAIKCSTFFISTKDFAYQASKLKFYENFIVIDKSILKDEIMMTANNPFSSKSKHYPMLEEAEEQEKFYGLSPYLSYFMKHNELPFYKRVFLSSGTNDNLRIYETLSHHEQITIDYLQSLHFKDKLASSNYNFEEARNTYMIPIGEGDLNQGIMKKLVDLYMFDYQKHKKELEFYQKVVTRYYEGEQPVYLTSKQEIQDLLMKFKRPAPIRRPPNQNNNNNSTPRYSPAVPLSPPPKTPEGTYPRAVSWGPPNNGRMTFQPVQTRKTVAPRTMGAFNTARLASQNQTRRNAQKRVEEIDAWLNSKKNQIEKAKTLYGNMQKLQPKFNFLTRKIKYLKGNTKKLSSNERNFLNSYVLMKQYEQIKKNRKQKFNTLQRSSLNE